MKNLLFTSFLWSLCQLISAQVNETTIMAISKFEGDSLVIRIAPSNPSAWLALTKNGCSIQRKEAPKGITMWQDIELKTWPLEKWKVYANSQHPGVPVVAQALYGKSFVAVDENLNAESIKNANAELEMRFTYSLLLADFDAIVATGLGWRFCDKNLAKNTQYVYLIIAQLEGKIDTAICTVNTARAPEKLPAPGEITAVENEKSIDLKWEVYLPKIDYTGWWIERSKDGTDWKKVNRTPFTQTSADRTAESITLTFRDTSIGKNYVPYHYRVKGISPFAEIGPSSPEIIAMGRDKTPLAQPEIQEPTENKGVLNVSWKLPGNNTDLKGFRVEKTNQHEGQFVPLHQDLLSPSTFSFNDPRSAEDIQHFYKIIAVDTAGNESSSLTAYGILSDSIPPAIPDHFLASIDTLGKVKLIWNLGQERDLLGYRIYFANAPEHEFSILSSEIIYDTTYTYQITLKTLSKRIYYKIVSVDKNFNHSKLSNYITLIKPDTIAPVKPIFSNFQVTDTCVTLSFVNSTSKDLKSQKLYKKRNVANSWDLLIEWKKSEIPTSFIDTDILENEYYQYVLEAIDSAGNTSGYSLPVKVKVYRSVKNDRITDFKINNNSGSQNINLSWKKPQIKVKKYTIYRNKEGELPTKLTQINGDLILWRDDSPKTVGKYFYLIKAYYENGNVSAETICDKPATVK